jgi:hypothetical protein
LVNTMLAKHLDNAMRHSFQGYAAAPQAWSVPNSLDCP